MHLGKFVFAQIVEFLPRYEFEKCVKRYKGDFHTKCLNSYNHLLQLIFGQITSCTSLRDICLCLKAHQNNLYHLGDQAAGEPIKPVQSQWEERLPYLSRLWISPDRTSQTIVRERKDTSHWFGGNDICIRLYIHFGEYQPCSVGVWKIQSRSGQDAHFDRFAGKHTDIHPHFRWHLAR